MQVLHERFERDPRVSVLAVHFDDRGDPMSYLREHDYTYASIPRGEEVARRFRITSLPTFLVVGPGGAVIHKHVGLLTDGARDEIERVALAASAGSG